MLVVVLVATASCALVLAGRRVRGSTTWRATVTPLASIIGSGFLVLAPLLAETVGAWAAPAMVGIVLAAYAIGAALRFNIVHTEALLASSDAPKVARDLERISRVALGFAYTISVAFYLRLLASFVLESVGVQNEFNDRVMTTGILVAIATIGIVRGLHGIETVEIPAVDVKIAVIAGLLAGMAVFDVVHGSATVTAYRHHPITFDGLTVARRLAGMLLVVQGFETSRYLGHYYGPALRARTMRHAQIISGAIYVGFAALVVTFFDDLGAGPRETSILDAARVVSPVLVPMLVVAAVASQLSAATADTAGGAEMLTDRPRHQPQNIGYPVVALGAVLVVWFVDVFSIVSLASRAFALYYLFQVILAAVAARRLAIPRYRRVVAANLALAAALMFIVVAATPSG